MCMSFSPPAARKSLTIDSSYPVFFDDTSIVIPYPKESTFERIAAVWAPFTSHVYLFYYKDKKDTRLIIQSYRFGLYWESLLWGPLSFCG